MKRHLTAWKNDVNDTHTISKVPTFTQITSWWYPHGKYYSNQKVREYFMGIFRELIEMRVANLNLGRATGVIPDGVAGFIPEVKKYKTPERPSLLGDSTLEIKVGFPINIDKHFFGSSDDESLEKKHNVKFNVFKSSKPEKLAEAKIDIIASGWAGGFNDPEGFLPVISKLLGSDFESYLGMLYPVYEEARSEQNWTKRARLYQSLNLHLLDEKRMVPAWKVNNYRIVKKNISQDKIVYSYTPKLSNFRKNKM